MRKKLVAKGIAIPPCSADTSQPVRLTSRPFALFSCLRWFGTMFYSLSISSVVALSGTSAMTRYSIEMGETPLSSINGAWIQIQTSMAGAFNAFRAC